MVVIDAEKAALQHACLCDTHEKEFVETPGILRLLLLLLLLFSPPLLLFPLPPELACRAVTWRMLVWRGGVLGWDWCVCVFVCAHAHRTRATFHLSPDLASKILG